MKRITIISTAIAVLTVISVSICAQEPEVKGSARLPKWVSEKGYWVSEGNIHNRTETTIRFYNNDNQLVYKETVMKRLNLRKRKTLVQIRKVLDEVVLAWEQKRPVDENLFAALSK